MQLPHEPHVRPLVGRLIGWSVGLYAIISIKSRNLHFQLLSEHSFFLVIIDLIIEASNTSFSRRMVVVDIFLYEQIC